MYVERDGTGDIAVIATVGMAEADEAGAVSRDNELAVMRRAVMRAAQGEEVVGVVPPPSDRGTT